MCEEMIKLRQMLDDRGIKWKDVSEDNFKAIADYWSVYLDRSIKAKDVAIMMTLFKIARMQTALKNKADSWIDAIGYLACGGEIAWKEEGED